MEGCGRKIGPFDCCTVMQGDCLEVIAQMPDGCVDLVVTSPPYNLGYENPPIGKDWQKPVDYKYHDDNMPEDEYQAWQKRCIAEMLRLVGLHGSVVYNHKPRQRKGLVILPHEWLLDFPIHQEVIWNRKGTQNNEPSFLHPVDERLFWLCPSGKPRIIGDSNYASVLTMLPEKGSDHPAPFPIILPSIFIEMLTDKADLVADFFVGSGTTIQAARGLGRHFFGADINPDYVHMAEERLSTVQMSYLT